MYRPKFNFSSKPAETFRYGRHTSETSDSKTSTK
ncbi:hypothetical protein CCACVL1_31027 [Corchorus capsularis]|uniref:Uncharacterized protein n=1 Tax=Corchorus capsularis TaxID=210143 RepID=A0A1R3FUG4_COCAP|nr:hypothetical protein CCACVL1_31027 [Corchorus capsularis]